MFWKVNIILIQYRLNLNLLFYRKRKLPRDVCNQIHFAPDDIKKNFAQKFAQINAIFLCHNFSICLNKFILPIVAFNFENI